MNIASDAKLRTSGFWDSCATLRAATTHRMGSDIG
jgi:hypothetical protein